MNIKEKNNQIIIENIKDFNIVHIFDCGQCFRWNKEEDGSYTGVVKDKVINVSQEGSTVIFDNVSMDDYENIIVDYFDLKTDYSEIKNTIGKDDIMAEAIKFGDGIRIDGFPRAQTSERVMAPLLQITRSAADITVSILCM